MSARGSGGHGATPGSPSNRRFATPVEPPSPRGVWSSDSEVRRLEGELAAHRRSFRAPAVARWTPAQTGRSLDAIAGHRLYALNHLIAFRGLRRAERSDHRQWRELLASAGVRDARLHAARHTAATLLLTQGVPARVVVEISGHSQISLTLGTYSHVVPQVAEDAAERMGRALWG